MRSRRTLLLASVVVLTACGPSSGQLHYGAPRPPASPSPAEPVLAPTAPAATPAAASGAAQVVDFTVPDDWMSGRQRRVRGR